MISYSLTTNLESIKEYRKLAEEFSASYEINDFTLPNLLDDTEKCIACIELYKKEKMPAGSTMHGAFYDVILFSNDSRIKEIGQLRMHQSMETAKALGLNAVVFHTNYNPFLMSESYDQAVISQTVSYIKTLLEEFPDITILLENMFDECPDIILQICLELENYRNFGVCLDVSHAYLAGDDIEIWFQTLASYIKEIHINDTDGKADLHLPLLEGVLPVYDVCEYIQTYCQSVRIVVEISDVSGQKSSLKLLHELLD